MQREKYRAANKRKLDGLKVLSTIASGPFPTSIPRKIERLVVSQAHIKKS